MTFEARGLTVRYGKGLARALDGVHMQVREGSFYAVLGPNGSGKSTLMKALLGVVRPASGRALVFGREALSWKRRELALRLGALPQQEHVAFPLSVRDLVAMGRYPHLGAFRGERSVDREAVDRALARCDLEHLRNRNVQTLSGGELQRARLARALAQEPEALALDEPTASLDLRHQMAILQLLRTSADDGVTVLLITHQHNLAARFADRFLLLSEGSVAAEGPAEEVFQEEVLEKVYRWPVKVWRDPLSGSPQIAPLYTPPASRAKAR